MKGAVLIIGSLFWDIHQGDFKNVRKDWRAKRLQFDKRIHVRTPIRYGRTSGEGVYTMVFSRSLRMNKQWGTAYAVPIKNDISSYQGIFNQAKYLSKAEGARDSNLVKGGDPPWCVIGILFNPKFDEKRKQSLLEKHQQKLEAENIGTHYTRFRIGREPSILSRQGEILIDWPTAVNATHKAALDKLDFILATCPQQNLDAYPDAATIKAAVRTDRRNYFYNNIAHGITTYQDRAIVEV